MKPVTHRVLRGELRHHYFLKDGQLAHQKADLTKHSSRQRIGYQMLVDDSGESVFVHLYAIGNDKLPSLPLEVFLAFAWATPAICAETARANGLPRILLVNPKDRQETRSLDALCDELNINLRPLPAGFAAGIHHVRAIQSALDEVMWTLKTKVCWLNEFALGNLSYLISVTVAMHADRNSFMNRAMDSHVHGPAPYERRDVPATWLETMATSHGCSWERLRLGKLIFFNRGDYAKTDAELAAI